MVKRLWRIVAMVALVALTGAATGFAQGDDAAGETAQPGGSLPNAPEISAVVVADGFESPVNVAHAGDGSGRLFVVERRGQIRIVDADGAVLDEPFLAIADLVESGGMEQGLLGLAFHPEYATNGRFFVYYSAIEDGALTLAEYAVSADDPDRGDPASARILLEIDDPFSNHNGGELEFGPDGYLYVAVGDGGGAGDPEGNGQNLGTLLGTILRIDVDNGDPYGIPADNPFVVTEDAAPEIFAYGLRNPWQFSFDAVTGDLLMGDVGQGTWEEINMIPAGTGGLNFGWPIMEGAHCYRSSDCEVVGQLPVAEYSHADTGGCSIIGLGVARSAEQPALDGIYFVADWCSGRFYGLARDDSGAWVFPELFATSLRVLGGGNGEDGAVYFTSDSFDGASGGVLWKLVEADTLTGDEVTPPLD